MHGRGHHLGVLDQGGASGQSVAGQWTGLQASPQHQITVAVPAGSRRSLRKRICPAQVHLLFAVSTDPGPASNRNQDAFVGSPEAGPPAERLAASGFVGLLGWWFRGSIPGSSAGWRGVGAGFAAAWLLAPCMWTGLLQQARRQAGVASVAALRTRLLTQAKPVSDPDPDATRCAGAGGT